MTQSEPTIRNVKRSTPVLVTWVCRWPLATASWAARERCENEPREICSGVREASLRAIARIPVCAIPARSDISSELDTCCRARLPASTPPVTPAHVSAVCVSPVLSESVIAAMRSICTLGRNESTVRRVNELSTRIGCARSAYRRAQRVCLIVFNTMVFLFS